jgi:hypothetical protein
MTCIPVLVQWLSHIQRLGADDVAQPALARTVQPAILVLGEALLALVAANEVHQILAQGGLLLRGRHLVVLCQTA